MNNRIKNLTLFLMVFLFPVISNADSLDEVDRIDEKSIAAPSLPFERRIRGLNCTTIDEVLGLPDEEIDIATALLILSKECNNTLNIREYRNKIDNIALEISKKIADTKTPQTIIEITNLYLFDSLGFKPKILVDDYLGSNPEVSLLSYVLDKKEGDCEGLSGLYLSVAERLNLPLYGVSLPTHQFVRYYKDAERINIETTEQGRTYSDEEYIKYYNLLSQESLRPLSKKDFIIDHIINVGTFWVFKNDPDRAILSLKKALKLHPENEHTHNALGIAYRMKGLTQEAIEEIKKAIEINPNIPDFYFTLGNIYDLDAKMKEEAILEYNKGLKTKPSFTIYYLIGNIYWNKNMWDEAITQYKQALELNPNYADAHFFIAYCYKEIRRYDLAWQHTRTAQKLGQPLAAELITELNKISSEPGLKSNY